MTPTQDELELTEVVREKLSRFVARVQSGENADAELRELQCVAQVSCTKDAAEMTGGFADADEMMFVARYGRCRLPMIVKAADPDYWVGRLPAYVEPHQTA